MKRSISRFVSTLVLVLAISSQAGSTAHAGPFANYTASGTSILVVYSPFNVASGPVGGFVTFGVGSINILGNAGAWAFNYDLGFVSSGPGAVSVPGVGTVPYTWIQVSNQIYLFGFSSGPVGYYYFFLSGSAF